MRWEQKFGMPVYRMGQSPRARVYANKEGLNEWRNKLINNVHFQKDIDAGESGSRENAGKHLPRPLVKYALITAVLLAPISLVILFKNDVFVSHRPANFHIDGSWLVILNSAGKEIGRFDSGIANLVDEKEYRKHFLAKQEAEELEFIRYLPYIVVEDIDRDGVPEILFSPRSTDDFQTGKIYCLDNSGKLKWAYSAGKELKFGPSTYSSDYVPIGIGVYDVNGDGFLEVLFISHCRGQFPTNISLLSAKGKPLAEYWNVGMINDFGFMDSDGNGNAKIVCAGQNNSFEKPCLIILDPRTMNGCSPHSRGDDCAELGAGTEDYYVLLPLSPVDEIYGPGIAISELDLSKSGNIQCLTTCSGLTYRFNKEFVLQEVYVSNTFEQKYNQAVRQGLLKVPLDKGGITKALRSGITYFDGSNGTWTGRPTMSNRRED